MEKWSSNRIEKYLNRKCSKRYGENMHKIKNGFREASKVLEGDVKTQYISRLLEDRNIYKHFEHKGVFGRFFRSMGYILSERSYTTKEIAREHLLSLVNEMKDTGLKDEEIEERISNMVKSKTADTPNIDINTIVEDRGRLRWLPRLAAILALVATIENGIPSYRSNYYNTERTKITAELRECKTREAYMKKKVELYNTELKETKKELATCIEGLNAADRNVELEADMKRKD